MGVSTATKKLSDVVVNQINDACRLGRKSVLISLKDPERPHTFFFTGLDWPDTQAGDTEGISTAIPQFGDYRTPGSTLGLPVCIVAYQQPVEHAEDSHDIIVRAEDIKHSKVHPPLFVFVDTACDPHLKLHCYLIPSDLLDIESVRNTKTPYQRSPDSAPSHLCLLKLKTRANLSVDELPNKLFEIYCSRSSSLKRGDSVRRPWRLGSLTPDGDYTCSIDDFLKAPIGLPEQYSKASEQEHGSRQIGDGDRLQGILHATPKPNQSDKRLLSPASIGSQERARGPKIQRRSSPPTGSSPAEPRQIFPTASPTSPLPAAPPNLLHQLEAAISSDPMNGTLQHQMSGGNGSEVGVALAERALQASTAASFHSNSNTDAPVATIDASEFLLRKKQFMTSEGCLGSFCLTMAFADLREQLLKDMIPSRGFMKEIVELLHFMRQEKEMRHFWGVFREMVGCELEEKTTTAFDEFLGELSSFAKRSLKDENGNVPPFQGPSADARRRAMERAEKKAEKKAEEEVEKKEY